MIEVLRWLVTFLGFAVVLTLAVLNRDVIPFVWSPAHAAVSTPVMIVVLGGVALGYIWGAVIGWINGSPLRARTRALDAQVRHLQDQLLAPGHPARPGDAPHAAPTTEEVLALLPPRKPWWRVFG